MHIILGTEIWGRTPHVVEMAKELVSIAGVTVVDPYDGTDQEFDNEEEAYSAFLEAGGHEHYAACMAEALAEASEEDELVCLVGFSAGAGAVWSAVSAENAPVATWALCFYGSAIRNMMEFEPKTQVELIFSHNEKHFDVENVARDLQDKANVQCYIAPFEHGFMNPAYEHFSQDVYAFWIDWIKGQLLTACAQQK